MELERQTGQDASMYSESEGYVADDETRPGSNALDNHVHGGPELAYSTPMPQEEKPGFFSRLGHVFGGQQYEKGETRNADAAPYMKFDREQPAPDNKGVGSSELGTGYEEDGEETINPAVVPKYDEGVKLPSKMQEAEKGFGNSEVGTGYEAGSEGSFSHS